MGAQSPGRPDIADTEAHGAVLFEDDWSYRHFRERYALGGLTWILGGACFFVLTFAGAVAGGLPPAATLLIGIVGAVFVILGTAHYVRIRSLVKLRIYGGGIQFPTGEFVDFSDIYCIEHDMNPMEYVRINTSFRHTNHHFDIVDAGIQSPLRGIGGKGFVFPFRVREWERFFNILAKQLESKHPGVAENRLIRDFINVTWSYEARQLWEARKGPEPVLVPRGGRERPIKEAVLASGRNQIEVSDVRPFLR